MPKAATSNPKLYNGKARVVVELSLDDYRVLRESAHRDDRTLAAQARWLLSRALRGADES